MPGQKINYLFVVFAACIAGAFLFADIAAESHRDHICDGESCPLCVIGRHIKNFSRQPKNLCFRPAFSAGAFLLSAFVLKRFFCSIPVSSVKLKIKMNT
ncbi:MAG: hypothetical protein LBG14_05215 [Treponema sp.]|jgi:hypothetical protein|nr:hypothetical protein [Treponema sp.]